MSPVRRVQSVTARIEAYNAGRRPALVARKFAAMRQNPFVFFRGTAHLFWEDWRALAGDLDDAPLAWCSGDLHLENFGSYRGDNRLAYFDINDFDEAALAPALRDPARFLTSVRLAAQSLGLAGSLVRELSETYLRAYAESLREGKARWIERTTATGMIRDLLRRVKRRTRAQLLATRLTRDGGKVRITLGERAFALPADERTAVVACMRAFAAEQSDPGFYRVLDVAGRIAGTGSLGVRRYAVLIAGRGTVGGERLLDVKEARPSSMSLYMSAALRDRQPAWRNEAERVVNVQHRMQAIAPALLTSVGLERGHFVMRELQPTEDRLSLDDWNGKAGRLRKVMRSMGELTAWAQLRSASRGGAAAVDALVDLGHDTRLCRGLIGFARRYAQRAESDWRAFCESVLSKS